MAKLKVSVDTTAKSAESTYTAVQNKAIEVHPNNVIDPTRDISGKIVHVEVDLPQSVDSDVDYMGDIDPLEVHANKLKEDTGVANVEHFPSRHIKDRSFEKASVGFTPFQWGGAQLQNLSGGTLAVSDDAGKACHGVHSLKAILNSIVGSIVNWEHVASTKNNKIVREFNFGFSINVPATASGVEIVVSAGCAPSGNGAAIVYSDGAPS